MTDMDTIFPWRKVSIPVNFSPDQKVWVENRLAVVLPCLNVVLQRKEFVPEPEPGTHPASQPAQGSEFIDEAY